MELQGEMQCDCIVDLSSFVCFERRLKIALNTAAIIGKETVKYTVVAVKNHR